jgi:hypothetical protein
MAVNVFRNNAVDITAGGLNIYTAPAGYSAIVLAAQISNTTSGTVAVSLGLLDVDSSFTSLLTDFDVPGNDAVNGLVGKLVLQTGQSLFVSAGDDTSLKLVLSVLESQN